MFRAVEKIDWVRDESMVVDRLKTGEVPPPDVQVPQFRSPICLVFVILRHKTGRFWSYFLFLQFQDMSATKVDRERKSSSLSRRISR